MMGIRFDAWPRKAGDVSCRCRSARVVHGDCSSVHFDMDEDTTEISSSVQVPYFAGKQFQSIAFFLEHLFSLHPSRYP